ncbi:hypothetical protein BJV74DRAFT_784650, partial [Russula compacta]
LCFTELRTYTQSPQVLLCSLYLSHLFSSPGLGNDYHGRLCRFQLNALGSRIEVRREVEVYAAGVGGALTPGSHGHIYPRLWLVCFEYPCSPPVVSMSPNGTPGSFKNSIPYNELLLVSMTA